MPVLAGEDCDLACIQGGKHFERCFKREGELFFSFSMIVFYILVGIRLSIGDLRIKVQNILNVEQVLDVYGALDDLRSRFLLTSCTQ